MLKIEWSLGGLGGWDLPVLCMYTCEWGSVPVIGMLCFDHLIAVLYIDIKAVHT